LAADQAKSPLKAAQGNRADRCFPGLQVRQTCQRVGRKLVLVPPRTERSERATPLPSPVAEALLEHWDRQVVGQSAIDVTMTIYASASLNDKREALKRLTDELG